MIQYNFGGRFTVAVLAVAILTAILYTVGPCRWGFWEGACVSAPASPRLAEYVPALVDAAGYRFDARTTTEENTNQVFVVLVFSGGGTRAAALAYGVLQTLRADSLTLGGARRSVLDEVDVISAVSGGSFTAAYYGLKRDSMFKSFEHEFLDWNAERNLAGEAIRHHWRLLSNRYSRSDLAAELWGDRLFGDATLGDLIRPDSKRPFVILNATHMNRGSQFSFTQAFLDPLCLNAREVPVSRAVAASSAFPGLLSPITFDAHPGTCGYSEPRWMTSAIDSSANSIRVTLRSDPMVAAHARGLRSYAEALAPQYIHLVDGGLSDNLGGRPLQRGMRGGGGDDLNLLFAINNGSSAGESHVIYIVVNARTQSDYAMRNDPLTPSWKDVLQAVADAPMSNYTEETLRRLEEDFSQGGRSRAQYYPVHLHFEGLGCPQWRDALLGAPTRFSLDSTTVDALIAAGAALLRQDSRYQAFLESVGGKTGPGPQTTNCDAAMTYSAVARILSRERPVR